MMKRMVALIALVLAGGCIKVVEQSVGGRVEPLQQAERPDLRDRLVAMLADDQKAREALTDAFSGGKQPDSTVMGPIAAKLAEVDTANTAELKHMIEQHGWPTRRRVGREGSNAAFLIAQHADRDRAFQKRYLEFIREEYRKGDVPGQSVALLDDRTRVGDGKKQRYGTQLRIADGKLIVEPIDDEKDVDKRRASLGLMPLAEYIAEVKKMYGLE